MRGTSENTCNNMVKFMYPLTLYPKRGIKEVKSEGHIFTAYNDPNLSVFSPNIKYFPGISHINLGISHNFNEKLNL